MSTFHEVLTQPDLCSSKGRLSGGCVARHERLALAVPENSALTAAALGEEAARREDAWSGTDAAK